VGLNHVVEVLVGADTEKIRKWSHHQLSTYGIGRDLARAEWGAIGRELIRLGLAKQDAQKFNVVELTPQGRAALSARRPIQLTRPMKVPARREHAVGEIACDEGLFERLRTLRKRLADERGVPSYIVFSDVALRQMARTYPSTDAEFTRISGVGQVKLRDFGAAFLAEIAAFLSHHPRQIFADESFNAAAPRRVRSLNDTTRETLRQFRAGRSLGEIAAARSLVLGTLYGHLANAVEAGEIIDLNRILSAEEQRAIREAFAQFGFGNLVGVNEALGARFDVSLLRLCRSVAQSGRG
jgi:ATP-dependent DNA helicase RecQ